MNSDAPIDRFRVHPGALRGCTIALDWDCRTAGLTLAQFERMVHQSGGRLHRGDRAAATFRVSERTRTAPIADRYGASSTPTLTPLDLFVILQGRITVPRAIATMYRRAGVEPLLPPEPFSWRKALWHAAEQSMPDHFSAAF